MKSFYAQYIYELEGIESVETDKYFFNFSIIENEFHVYEVFILPEFRSSSVSNEMSDRIESLAIEKGCEFVVGYVHRKHPNHEISLAYQKRRGMRILKEENGKVTLIREAKRV